MRIEGIDIYWVKLPLAFVWRTSYADQRDTDTILVRMEGGGHHAWGESCPVYVPAYSAEHTIATFHTLREHMAPRIIGEDLESAQDLLDRISFVKGHIKTARVGGLTASRDIQSLCAEHDIPCWVGGMLESAIGGAICAELATLPNFTYPGDIFPSSYFYRNDIGKPEIVLSGRGEVATSAVPGIPQEPDADLLKQWTVEHASFRV